MTSLSVDFYMEMSLVGFKLIIELIRNTCLNALSDNKNSTGYELCQDE